MSFRRKGSFQSTTDKSSERSTTCANLLRVSGDSCKLEAYQETPETLVLYSAGKGRKPKDRMLSNSSARQPEVKSLTSHLTSQRKANGEVKSILKKQSSLERINYTKLLSLLSAEFIPASLDCKADDIVFDATAFPPPITSQPIKAQHSRRVRFSENVSFRLSDSDTQYLIEDFSDDVTDIDCVSVTSLHPSETEQRLPNDTAQQRNDRSEGKLPDASPSDRHDKTKLKKDIRAEPVTKRTRLSSCGNFSVTSKMAWSGKNDVSSSGEETQVKKTTERKLRISASINGRCLDRSKTDLGFNSYKDVQSKLRRMGCLDFKQSLIGRKNVKHVSRSEEDLTRSNLTYWAGGGRRGNSKYATVREEVYDIGDHLADDILSAKYVTEACNEAGIRSLGDAYARFLKGRYKVDDVTCS